MHTMLAAQLSMAGQQDNDYKWREIHGSVPCVYYRTDDITEAALEFIFWFQAGVH